MIRLFKLFCRSFFLGRGHFLVLFQNNNELRATGGFITALVDISRFKLKSRKVFGEMDKHNPVLGPKPLMEMLRDGHYKSWTFRDANYFPEFSESAKYLIEFYNRVFPHKKVDSILAVNFSFVENFLKVLGPIRLRVKELSFHELFYFLTAEVSDIDRHNLEALSGRKQVLLSLAKRMLSASLLRFWRWPHLVALIKRSFRTKDLQVYSRGAQRMFFYDKGQDFLAVIDSNFLGLKSNRYLNRSVHHDSLINEGAITNDVRIIWEHLGTYNRPLSGLYQSYARVYLPKEVKKVLYLSSLKLEGVTQKQEGDFMVFAFKLRLRPQEKLVLNLSYSLPLANSIRYQFKYFKQSGVSRENLHKIVQFPKIYGLLPTAQGMTTENLFTYDQASVEEDIDLEISSSKALHAPRILKHEINSPDTIVVRFSEPIQLPKKSEKIFTLVKKGSRKRLNLTKVYLNEDRTSLNIQVKGLPPVEEQFYLLQLKGISSLDGMPISPNPRIVTVVYRSRFFKKV